LGTLALDYFEQQAESGSKFNTEDKMKKIGYAVAAALTLAAFQAVPVIAAENAKTMKCEVVDVACYVAKGAHGPDHKTCAVKCITSGGELALLSGNKLYIPVDKDFHSARDQFVPQAGEMVDVTGTVIKKGGVNYFQLTTTNEGSAAAAAPASK
jgi:hypothetical protein